ncbi:hypothetical protein JAAARDRAFT_338679 [Jaapia argillacea MUCL 33604]|uniref:Uncharacterized protein n=1 Tax=Jaapia argillacea MUCL 33604 TaxID=933084 RepID=A0A067PYU0_9AGAM|nr:hypothetical protein JAAARDRAFT_338679 [Jaapia argillacea MUCL 33604]
MPLRHRLDDERENGSGAEAQGLGGDTSDVDSSTARTLVERLLTVYRTLRRWQLSRARPSDEDNDEVLKDFVALYQTVIGSRPCRHAVLDLQGDDTICILDLLLRERLFFRDCVERPAE